MTLGDFKAHFIKCAKKYLIHHFNDVLSSQARRNLYEKNGRVPRTCDDNHISIGLLSNHGWSFSGSIKPNNSVTLDTVGHFSLLSIRWGSYDNCIFILASARNNKA